MESSAGEGGIYRLGESRAALPYVCGFIDRGIDVEKLLEIVLFQKEVKDVKSILHWNAGGTDDFRSDEQVKKEAAATKAWCLSAR